MKKYGVKGLGLSVGIVSAIFVLVLGILRNLIIYMGSPEVVTHWYSFFSLSFIGILLGMIKAFFIGGIFGMLVAYFYNMIEKK